MNFEATNDLQALLLAVFIAALLAARYLGPSLKRLERKRGWLAGLGVLAALSIYAYLNLFQMHPGLGASHPFEFYHYYVGTKYFGELGYTGLYEATVVADLEDDPRGFVGRSQILNQRTYEYEYRDHVVQRADRIKAPFTPARWSAFKDDIGYLRSRTPKLWRSSRIQRDHGYNGTPLTTLLLGTLARAVPVRAEIFVAAAAWLDPLLIFGTGIVIARLAGASAGLLFVFLWAVNPFNAYGYIGGAYLRHLYLAAFALAAVCFWKGRPKSAGVLAALSSGIAIFPALPVAALLLRDLLRSDRAAALRGHARFYAAFTAACVLFGVVSSLAAAPGRLTPWLEFREAMSVHASSLSPNHVGLASLIAYEPAHDLAAIEAGDATRDWLGETLATLESRKLLLRAAQLVWLAAIVWFLRGAAPLEAWFGGFVALYAFVPVSHYYWASLCVVPLVFGLERRSLLLLSGFWLLVTGLRQFEGLDTVLDRLMFAVSCAAGVYFAAALLSAVRARTR